MVLDYDLSDQKFPLELQKSVNALLNSKGGYIVVHAEELHHLDYVDGQIDSPLRQMLPKNLCYHDVFRRYTHEDGKHLVYFVDCSSRVMPLSICTPHTKVSLNRGLESASQSEVMCLVGRAWPSEVLQQQASGDQEPELREEQRAGIGDAGHDRAEDMAARAEDMAARAEDMAAGHDAAEDMETSNVYDRREQFMRVLAEGEEIKYEQVPFVEDFRMQAKPHENEHMGKDVSVDKLFGYLWGKQGKKGKQGLQHYICAFSSVPGGGSYYLGIKEAKETQLTTFVCQGIALDERKKDDLKRLIKKELSNMVCIGSRKPGNQLKVLFHPVKVAKGRPRCVIEIRVMEYKHGAVFCRHQGPEVYTMHGNSNPKRLEMTLGQLLKGLTIWSRHNTASQSQLQHFPFEFQ